MKIYTAYSRSIGFAIFVGVVYCVAAFMLLAFVIHIWPDWPNGAIEEDLFALALLLFCVLLPLASRIAATDKVVLTLGNDKIKINDYGAQIYIYKKHDKEVLFSDIRSYTLGNKLKIYLSDNSKLVLHENYAPFVKSATYQFFIVDFIHSYESYKDKLLQTHEKSVVEIDKVAKPGNNSSEDIKTRKSIKFYSAIFILCTFYITTAGIFILLALNGGLIAIVFALLSLGLFIVGTYVVRRYITNAIMISANSSGINIAGKTRGWTELVKIELAGKQPYKLLIGSDAKDGMRFQFKDGNVVYLYDMLYTNIEELKFFIRQQMLAGVIDADVSTIYLDAERLIKTNENNDEWLQNVTYQHIAYFKGSQFYSLGGVLWFFFAIFITAVLVSDIPPLQIMLAFAAAVCLTAVVFGMNYFGVSPQYISVRKHNLPWVEKLYDLASVEQVILSKGNRGANVMKILFRDFTTKTYAGHPLRDADWIGLLQAMQAKGINVKDENHFVLNNKPGIKKLYKICTRLTVAHCIIFVVLLCGDTVLSLSYRKAIAWRLCCVAYLLLGIAAIFAFAIPRMRKLMKEKGER